MKACIGIIRRVKGRALIEALFQLQGGRCAYDLRPCGLLTPQLITEHPNLFRGFTWPLRFATLDHVNPRKLGGQNILDNFVMACADKNQKKGHQLPEGRWQPHFTHRPLDVVQALANVERRRLEDAAQLASTGLPLGTIKRRLVEREVDRLNRDIKFYSVDLRMVA